MQKEDVSKLIKLMNEKLAEKHLSINSSIYIEYERIFQLLHEKISVSTAPLKFIILGEATTSYKNYFYNPVSRKTAFLEPGHFGIANKDELITFLERNNTLIFDLYPLPLPTFIYDTISFNNLTVNEYQHLLNCHYKLLRNVINSDTKILLRYSKIIKRTEWTLFNNYIESICGHQLEVIDISTSNMGANRASIRQLFNLDI